MPRALKRRLELLSLVQNLFQSISLGSVLLLAAVGLAITFGITSSLSGFGRMR